MANEKYEVAAVSSEVVIPEKSNDRFDVVLQTLEDGTQVYKRKMKYSDRSTVNPESVQEVLALAELLDSPSVISMKDAIGEVIDVADVVIRKYDRVNDKNGELEYGATTALITHSGQVYATSSKSFLNKIMDRMNLFNWSHFDNEGDFVITPLLVKQNGSANQSVSFKMILK